MVELRSKSPTKYMTVVFQNQKEVPDKALVTLYYVEIIKAL